MSSAAGERLLTTEQVAELFQVPVDTVKWWRKRGRGPRVTRVGRYCRYTPQAVADYIKANTN